MPGRTSDDRDELDGAGEEGLDAGRLYPGDGYKVAHFVSELRGREELYLELYVQSRLQFEAMLIMWANFGDVPEIANLRNTLHLYRAMCRFVNAGGSPGTMMDLGSDMFLHMKSTQPQISLPPGHLLLDAIEETRRQNIIRQIDGECLVITEDEWAEVRSDTDLAQRVPGEFIPSAFDTFPEDEHGTQPRLQHHQDSEAEAEG